MGPRHDLWFCACTTACLASELLVSMAPSPHLWFLHSKQRLSDPNNKSLWVPDSTCHFVHAIQSDYHQNFLSLLVPVLILGLCMRPESQVCICPRPHLRFWAHITACLAQECQDYMSSSPNLWCCAYKTETLGLELKVSFGPRHDLSFCACTTAWLAPELQGSMGPWPHLSFCACKTACLASELLVSTGKSPHLWFLDAEQRLLYQNDKSLWVPDITCHFVHANQRD